MIEFTVNQKLPSLNEYTAACRANKFVGAKFKQDIEEVICWAIRQAQCKGTAKPTDKPCEIFIEWHEKTKRRDCDNIQSSQKFILDALQAMHIIPNDNRKYIKQVNHKIIDDSDDFVVVNIVEI